MTQTTRSNRRYLWLAVRLLFIIAIFALIFSRIDLAAFMAQVREIQPAYALLGFALVLAALSCVVAAVVAYLAVYGLAGEGLPAYTRMFGHVFNPSVSLIFVIKTLFFGLAVAVIPMASGANEDIATPSSRESAALHPRRRSRRS